MSESPYSSETESLKADAEATSGPSESISSSTDNAAAASKLRWWPAGLILLAMVAARFLPTFAEEPSLLTMTIRILGPGALSVFIGLWWVTFSRARRSEKIVGFLGLIGIAVVSMIPMHPSMQGMGALLFQFPVGLALFAIATRFFASQPVTRMTAGLAAAAIGFGVWNAVRLEGTTGAFDTELAWRFADSAEDEYLEQLEKQQNNAPDASLATESTIDPETSEWSDFRGPHRDGTAPGLRLATDWDANPPKEIWRRRIGPGWGSWSVAGDRLYTQEQRGENEAIVCIDAKSGKTVWDHEYPSRFEEPIAGAGPRATPTIGRGVVYCQGASGDVVALNAISGEEVWSVSLQDLADRIPPTWGWSSSPLLVSKDNADESVIVYAGGDNERGLFALDAGSGEVKWSAAAGNHTYSSPQWATMDGVRGFLFVDNQHIYFSDPETGQRYWDYEWVAANYRVIQPQQVDSRVLFATPLNTGAMMIEATAADDGWSVKQIWDSSEIRSAYNDWVFHEGYLYGFDNSIFACASWETGEREWKRGRYGAGQVLLLPDADQLLVVGEQGELVLLETNPKRLVELTKMQALDGKTWNHPVLIKDRLYLRNGREAVCFEMPVEILGKSNDSEGAEETPDPITES